MAARSVSVKLSTYVVRCDRMRPTTLGIRRTMVSARPSSGPKGNTTDMLGYAPPWHDGFLVQAGRIHYTSTSYTGQRVLSCTRAPPGEHTHTKTGKKGPRGRRGHRWGTAGNRGDRVQYTGGGEDGGPERSDGRDRRDGRDGGDRGDGEDGTDGTEGGDGGHEWGGEGGRASAVGAGAGRGAAGW